jgi:hypothetical protein
MALGLHMQIYTDYGSFRGGVGGLLGLLVTLAVHFK